MNDTGIHQFQLNDARGQPHDYVVTEHPAGDGMAVMYELLGLGIPSVLGLLGSALKSEDLMAGVLDAIGGSGLEFGAGALGRALGEIDFGKLGPEIGRALGTGKAPALTRQILSRTIRDCKPLRDDAQFGMAFQANYAELMQLTWRVCSLNRFFPVSSTLLGSASDPSKPGETDLPEISLDGG